ncbi:hypothetical protein [Streptomyces sp. NPDC001978]|uniref:hypothetical protein n=1 Tax=Streptomyces sp. NPDC001978 TaxID=3364627 RepID=UPI00367EAE6A
MVFLILVAVWCFAGRFFATRPVIAEALSRWGHILLPLVLIAIGLFILFHDDVDIEVGQPVDPGAVPLADQVLADRLGAVRVAHLRGQQRQVLRGSIRKLAAHNLLLPGDQRGGRRGDGQTSMVAVGLVVVVDEDGLTVFIGIETVPGQEADFLRPSFRDGVFRCGQVNILMALTDIGPGDGGTLVVPASHKSNLQHPQFETFKNWGTGMDAMEAVEEVHVNLTRP